MKKTEDRNVFPLSGARGSLKFEYLHCINYAMVMNGRNPLIRCVVENCDDAAWHDVEIEISGDMIAPSSAHIDCVRPQSEFDVADAVRLNDV